MDIKQLQDGMLYHALKQEQEAIFLENQLQIDARNDEKINTKRYHYFTVILNDKQYTIYLDDQKIDNVTQLLQVIKVQLIDDEVLKESDKITSIETQIGSVVTKTVLKKITTEPTCFVIQIEQGWNVVLWNADAEQAGTTEHEVTSVSLNEFGTVSDIPEV